MADERWREEVIEGLNKFKMQAEGNKTEDIFELTMSSALAEVI